MTCIVGWLDKKNKTAYMGGDSAGVNDSFDIRVRKDVKVFKRGEMLFGYTSSFRMGQLLRFELVIPKHKSNVDTYEYMCTDFIEAVRQLLKKKGFTTVSSNSESIGTFLVIYKGRLFEIEDDLQVAEDESCYNSCGCGARYALGSLYSTDQFSKDSPKAEDIVRNALATAAALSAGVRGPFNVVSIKY
jgi:ATP-dependent protease HslVU (ClpYQ) peptidase subunit